MLKHCGVIRDGESKVTAQIGSGGEEEHLDFANLLEDPLGASVVMDLARRGLLRLDTQGFKRQEAEHQHGATVRRFIYKTPRSQRLMLTEDR